jgi:hypothetical protein
MKSPIPFLLTAFAGAFLAAGATTGVRAGDIPVLSENEKHGIIGDTSEVKGAVKYANKDDGLLVIGSAFGDETIYFEDQTEFPPNARDRILHEGAKIRAWYVMARARKMATRIEMQ